MTRTLPPIIFFVIIHVTLHVKFIQNNMLLKTLLYYILTLLHYILISVNV